MYSFSLSSSNTVASPESCSVHTLVRKLAWRLKFGTEVSGSYIEQLKVDGPNVNMQQKRKMASEFAFKIYDRLLNLNGTYPKVVVQNHFFIAEDYIFQLRQRGETLLADKFEAAYQNLINKYPEMRVGTNSCDVHSKEHDVLRMLFSLAKLRADVDKSKVMKTFQPDVSKDFERADFYKERDFFGITCMKNFNLQPGDSKMFDLDSITSEVESSTEPISTDTNELLILQHSNIQSKKVDNSNARKSKEPTTILFGAVSHRPHFLKSENFKTLNFELSLPALGVAPVDIFGRNNNNDCLPTCEEGSRSTGDLDAGTKFISQNTKIEKLSERFISLNKCSKSLYAKLSKSDKSCTIASKEFGRKAAELSTTEWNLRLEYLQQKLGPYNFAAENIFSLPNKNEKSNRIGKSVNFKSLFLLLQGSPSPSFIFNESKMQFEYNHVFGMDNNFGLTPSSIKNMITLWLWCGTCIRRLEHFAVYFKSNSVLCDLKQNDTFSDIMEAFSNGLLHYISIHCAFTASVFANTFDPDSDRNQHRTGEIFDIIHANAIMMPWIERMVWLADDICRFENFDMKNQWTSQFSKFPYKGEKLLTYLYTRILSESMIATRKEPIRLTLIKYLFQYALVPWLQSVNNFFFTYDVSQNFRIASKDFLIFIGEALSHRDSENLDLHIKDFNEVPCFIDLQAYNLISKAMQSMKLLNSMKSSGVASKLFHRICFSDFQLNNLCFTEVHLQEYEQQLEQWMEMTDTILQVDDVTEKSRGNESWRKELSGALSKGLTNGEKYMSTAKKLRLAAEEDQVDQIRQREEENERKRQLLAKIESQILERRRILNDNVAKEKEFDDFFISQLALNTPRALGGGGILSEENALKVAAKKMLYERYGQNIKRLQDRTKLFRWRLQRSQTISSSRAALTKLLKGDEKRFSVGNTQSDSDVLDINTFNNSEHSHRQNAEINAKAASNSGDVHDSEVVQRVEDNAANKVIESSESQKNIDASEAKKYPMVDSLNFERVTGAKEGAQVDVGMPEDKSPDLSVAVGLGVLSLNRNGTTSNFDKEEPGGTSTAQQLIYNQKNELDGGSSNLNAVSTTIHVSQSPGGNSTIDNSMSGKMHAFKTNIAIQQDPGGTSTAQNLIYNKNADVVDIDVIERDSNVNKKQKIPHPRKVLQGSSIEPKVLNFSRENVTSETDNSGFAQTTRMDAVATAYADAYMKAMPNNIQLEEKTKVKGSLCVSNQKSEEEWGHDVRNLEIGETMERCVIRPLLHQCKIINRACVVLFLRHYGLNLLFDCVRKYILMSEGHIMQEFIQTVWRGYLHPDALTDWGLEGNINRAFISAVRIYGENNRSTAKAQLEFVQNNFSYKFKGRNNHFMKHMNAYDLLCLDHLIPVLNISWPLNIVVTKKSMERYHKIHTLLMRLQLVKLTLCEAWLNAMKVRPIANRSEEIQDKLVLPHIWYIYQQDISHFLRVFVYYVSTDVIKYLWKQFSDDMGGINASKMDDIYSFQSLHDTFTSRLVKRTFVEHPSLLSAINDVLSKAMHLSHLVQKVLLSRYDEMEGSILSAATVKAEFEAFVVKKKLIVQILEDICKGRGATYWATKLLYQLTV